MKKTIIVICVIVICILISITYAYSMYKSDFNKVQKFNNEFSKYVEQEFSGTDLATIINLAIDNNEKYKIAKDGTGKYQEDDICCRPKYKVYLFSPSRLRIPSVFSACLCRNNPYNSTAPRRQTLQSRRF